MPLIEPKDELKSETTSSKPRDETGHFINIPEVAPSKSIIDKFLLSHIGNYKDQEDLLDIKVGNPLGRIMMLLEDIKKQKAFSFTLKGSLGIAGVILTLSVFGIFGGSQILCDKGTQSKLGTVRELNVREVYTKSFPVVSYLLEIVAPPKKLIKNRTILMNNDGTTIYLPFSETVDISKYKDNQVIITGSYNSCSQTLTVEDASGIEYK